MRYFGFKRKVEVNNESGRPPYQKGEGPAAFYFDIFLCYPLRTDYCTYISVVRQLIAISFFSILNREKVKTVRLRTNTYYDERLMRDGNIHDIQG